MTPRFSRYSPHSRPSEDVSRRSAWLAQVEMAMVSLKPAWSWRFDRDLALDLMRQGRSVQEAAEWLVATSS